MIMKAGATVNFVHFSASCHWRAAAIGEANIEASANCVRAVAAIKACRAHSWASEESQIESREHQDDADVRYQPFPESVSEERDIQTDHDGYHCDQVKRDSN